MNERKPCYVFGAGGHAMVLLDELLHDRDSLSEWKVKAIVTPDGTAKKNFDYLDALGIPILPETDETFLKLKREGCYALVAIGDNTVRKHLSEYLRQMGIPLGSFIGGQAYISRTARISTVGVQILNRAYIGPGAVIGDGVILNHKCMVEHYAEVGAYSHIAPGATLLGAAKAGRLNFIGANATVLPDVTLTDRITVGAGGVVCHHLSEPGVYAGVPARRIK